MKLILKEVEGDRAVMLQDEILEGGVDLLVRIWAGLTPDTCMVEIDFEEICTIFTSDRKDGKQLFEFIDMSDEDSMTCKATIFELTGAQFGSYEVV